MNKERELPCKGDWHYKSYEQYAKEHGGGYPRSCPECGSFFNPEPKEMVKESKCACGLDGEMLEELMHETFYRGGMRKMNSYDAKRIKEYTTAIINRFGKEGYK